ncbi:MAG: hypothetical protein KGI27_09740 [Thaumarchaeota archaeon]|nr:hypothetical protein [Nitrososphaerota archaeon]
MSRKKRYALFAVITAIGVSVALYNSLHSFNYGHSKDWNFDSYQNNALPSDFAAFQSNSPSGLWVIKADDSAPSKPNVFASLPVGNSSGYHMQVMPDSPDTSDAQISVKFKIMPGHHVEQAGLIIRFIDPSHYFVLMADPQNNRLSLCKADIQFLVCNYETHVPISTGQWHTLEATISSEGIGGWLDGSELIKANNEYYQTGQIGLWTKDDTEAYFDDLQIKY